MANRVTLADKNAMLARGEPYIVHPSEVAKFIAVYETDPEILLARIVESGTLDTSAVLRTVQRMLNALAITDEERVRFEAFRRLWSYPTDNERAAVIALAQRIAANNDRPLRWQTRLHSHAWIPIQGDDHREVCELCGAFRGTAAGNALCHEPWPEMPEPPEGWGGLAERRPHSVSARVTSMAFEFGTHFLDELALAGELYDGQEEDIGEMIAFAKRIHTETRPARRALFDNASRADAALLEHLADNLEEVWLDAQLEHSTLARHNVCTNVDPDVTNSGACGGKTGSHKTPCRRGQSY